MPSPATEPVVGILVAVREELAPLLARAREVRRDSCPEGCYHVGLLGGRRVVMARSGMGPNRSDRMASGLLERYAPSVLLAGGFAAALHPELRPGDLVLATEVRRLCVGSDGPISGAPPLRPPGIADLAGTGGGWRAGALVTVEGVASAPGAKRAIADAVPDAIAVDMESYAAAAQAAARHVPWLVVRAITDGAEDRLPFPFDRWLGRDGEVQRWRVAAGVATQPWRLPSLVRLGLRSARAAARLATCVEALCSRTLPMTLA